MRISKVGQQSLSALVVVHNASQNEMTVNGRVPMTMNDGGTCEINLPQNQLSAGETKVIDVTQLLTIQGVRHNEVVSAGVELQHSGDFGSLITSAFSVSDNGNQVFRVPLWDVAAQRSATGGYPWYIEGNSSTLVYIKNATAQPRQFRMYVMFDGSTYLYPLTTVAPSQTTTIDIRALRDNQVPDMNGNTIPLVATHGQVQWSMTAGEDKVLIGRSEQVDLPKGVSSNYACINCCGNSFYDAWLTPNQGDGFEREEIQFIAMQQDVNCYGHVFTAHQVGASFSGNPSICDPNSTGLATGIAPGSSGIFGQWGADEWISWGNDQCQYSPVDVLRDALCDILEGPHHVKVVLDQQGVPQSCPTTGLNVREITVQIVNANNQDITTSVQIREDLSNVSTNTCGNGSPSNAPCALDDGAGEFTDQMVVSKNVCNSGINRNSGCGYTLTSNWRWCGAGITRSIWTYNGETRSNGVKVNGNLTSYNVGTFLYGTGGP